MEGNVLSESRIQSQRIRKPTAVIVFGILNIFFAVFGLLVSSLIIFMMISADKVAGPVSMYKKFLWVMNVTGFCFSVWLLFLGIGLLRLAKWARRGSIIYACLGILLFIIETGMNVLVFSFGWVPVPNESFGEFIGGMLIGVVGGFIYPIVLLIFMQTAKVKLAFEAIEWSG